MFSRTNLAILIADTDSSVARTFRRLFEKNGYKVDVAETAKEACKQLSKHHYESALIDIELLEMDCITSSQASKISPETLKIIFTDFPKLKNSIEDDQNTTIYLEKPIQPEKLLKLLEEKLKRKD